MCRWILDEEAQWLRWEDPDEDPESVTLEFNTFILNKNKHTEVMILTYFLEIED